MKYPQIFTECREIDQDFIFNGKGQYALISISICQRDGSDVVEMKSFLMKWLLQSLDLSLCDFFLWEYVKGLVYASLLLASINELKQRVTSALNNVTRDMLQHVWQELNYRLDVCHVTGCAHIEHSWNWFQNKLMIFNT